MCISFPPFWDDWTLGLTFKQTEPQPQIQSPVPGPGNRSRVSGEDPKPEIPFPMIVSLVASSLDTVSCKLFTVFCRKVHLECSWIYCSEDVLNIITHTYQLSGISNRWGFKILKNYPRIHTFHGWARNFLFSRVNDWNFW